MTEVNVNVQVTRTEPDLVPFGLLWKIYDLLALKGNDFMVPIRKPLPDHFPCSLLKDISFLFGRHLSFFRRLSNSRAAGGEELGLRMKVRASF